MQQSFRLLALNGEMEKFSQKLINADGLWARYVAKEIKVQKEDA